MIKLVKFVLWFTLIPWLVFSVVSGFSMLSDASERFGALGMIGFVIVCVCFFPIVAAISVFLGFFSSWAWVFSE